MANHDRTEKVVDDKATIEAETAPGDATVIGADEAKGDGAIAAKTAGDTITIGGNQTPEEQAIAAIPVVSPRPDDPPEANPAHPSSLRVRSDGDLVQKGTRRGEPDQDIDRLPGWEQAEPDPRSVPSHPSKLEPDPTGISNFRVIDAAAEGEPGRERQSVQYTGTEAVTVIVPEKGGGYDSLVTEGQTYNFRPGQVIHVPSKDAAWLMRHPRLSFAKA